jgi:hypothetical protein
MNREILGISNSSRNFGKKYLYPVRGRREGVSLLDTK